MIRTPIALPSEIATLTLAYNPLYHRPDYTAYPYGDALAPGHNVYANAAGSLVARATEMSLSPDDELHPYYFDGADGQQALVEPEAGKQKIRTVPFVVTGLAETVLWWTVDHDLVAPGPRVVLHAEDMPRSAAVSPRHVLAVTNDDARLYGSRTPIHSGMKVALYANCLMDAMLGAHSQQGDAAKLT